MKAVNQSIGRAIRHSRDYACIVLADVRYERPSVIKRLPQWIASQLQVCKNFGSAFAAARKVIQQLGLIKLRIIPFFNSPFLPSKGLIISDYSTVV